MTDNVTETSIVIGYSRWKAAGWLLLYIGAAGICIYCLSQRKWGAIIGLPIAILGMVIRARQLLYDQPQLLINEQGIRRGGGWLDSWRVVRNVEIQTRQQGRNPAVYLCYRAGRRDLEVDISDLDMEAELLKARIAEYQAAYVAAEATGTTA
jgi:hypothetical protein